MSSGVPRRPSGIVACSSSSRSETPSTSRKASVATGPGDTALTRMPRGASSSASVWVRLSMPALAAAYGPVRGEPRVPAPDEMLMITPPAVMR